MKRALRFPDGGGDVAITQRLIVEIIDGDDFAVGSLDAARVADVAASAVAANRPLGTPCAPAIGTQLGANLVRLGPVAVGQAKAAVLQANHARRVAFAGVVDGCLIVLP